MELDRRKLEEIQRKRRLEEERKNQLDQERRRKEEVERKVVKGSVEESLNDRDTSDWHYY